MGGEFTYQPKWDPIGFDNHSHDPKFVVFERNATSPKNRTPYGCVSKSRTPSAHSNPKIGSKMGGEFTYQPKWDPIGFDNHSHDSARKQVPRSEICVVFERKTTSPKTRTHPHGCGSKSRTPSEHPNPTTNIGSKMGREFTYQPKWDPIGFDPQPSWRVRWPRSEPSASSARGSVPPVPSATTESRTLGLTGNSAESVSRQRATTFPHGLVALWLDGKMQRAFCTSN